MALILSLMKYKNLSTRDRFSYIQIHLSASLSDHHQESFDLIVPNQQVHPHCIVF